MSALQTRAGRADLTPPEESLLTTQEVAALLNVKASWVLDQWQAGKLPGFRLGVTGGPVRFRRHEILTWLESRRRGPLPQAMKEHDAAR
jgi:excisionase family DNA binding protein